jgi:hypothetical protein
MDTEFSSLRIEPGRIRVARGTNQRLMADPVEVVEESPVDGGREVVLRSPANAVRVFIADDDADSLAVLAGLPHGEMDPAAVAALKGRIEVAATPLNPEFDRFSDAQIRQQAKVRRYNQRVRTNTLAVAALLLIAAIIAALAR